MPERRGTRNDRRRNNAMRAYITENISAVLTDAARVLLLASLKDNPAWKNNKDWSNNPQDRRLSRSVKRAVKLPGTRLKRTPPVPADHLIGHAAGWNAFFDRDGEFKVNQE